MATIFNLQNIDYTKEPMFFGENLNSQRFDKFKYAKFDQLNEQMLSFFWRPQEVSLQKDRNDFLLLTDAQKHIFTSNLKYQTLLDSVQGRAPALAFLPIVSIPELESAVNTWNFFEGSIHSKSYSYIMQNVYSDPTKIFDSIMIDPAIISRARSVCDLYDDFINEMNVWRLTNTPPTYELKKKLYLALVNVNILEGLRFYVSFACTFAFGENKLMEGSAKILSLIARDENVHYALTTNILNMLIAEDPDYKTIRQTTEDEVIGLYHKVIEEEKAWASHLFQSGGMVGLNDKLLWQYVDYMAHKRSKNLGYKLNIDNVKSNPLPWTQNWLSSKQVQEAPQETEKESYLIGGLKQDLNLQDFANFTL